MASKLDHSLTENGATMSVYPHLEQRADGKWWLIGTQTKVIEIALDRLAYHWDADEIQCQHPHLNLGQIYSSLAFYYDHHQEMDRSIDDQLELVKQARLAHGRSAMQIKLQSQGIAS